MGRRDEGATVRSDGPVEVRWCDGSERRCRNYCCRIVISESQDLRSLRLLPWESRTFTCGS